MPPLRQRVIPQLLAGGRGAHLATLVVFVAFLDFFMGLPLVPTYARELGATPAMAGAIVGAYSATNLVGNVIAGYFLDRFGRGLPILAGLIFTSLALVGYAFAPNASTLLVVRSFHGLAAAVLTPGAFAVLGDSTHQGARARTMGRSAAGIAIAAVIGPLSAGVLKERVGYESVFLIAAALMAATALVYALASWHASRRPADVMARPDEQMNTSGNAEPFRITGLAIASVVAVALTVGIGTLAVYLPLHVQELGGRSSTSGAAFTLYAIMAFAMMVGAVGVIGDRYNRLAIVSAGLTLFGAGLLLMATTQDLWAIYVGMSVIGLGFGLLFPPAAALVADSGGTRRRGLAFGIFYGAYSLGVTVGAVISGRIADLADGLTGMPYLVAALVVAVSIVASLGAMVRGAGGLTTAAKTTS